MGLSAFITDALSMLRASVDGGSPERPEVAGLVVATRPLKRFENRVQPFTSDELGFNMNVNGKPPTSGGDEAIHDGNDSTLWTGTVVTGGWNFSDGAQAHSGSQSIDARGANGGDAADLSNPGGANLDSLDYAFLSLWVYVDNWNTTGEKDVEFRWRLDGSPVGAAVRISNFINTQMFDEWQQALIPMAEFALAGSQIDALRISIIQNGGGAAPNVFLDDIDLLADTGAAGAIPFVVQPRTGKWYHVEALRWSATVAKAGDSGNPVVDPGEFFGISALATGVVFQRRQFGGVQFASSLRSTYDVLAGGRGRLDAYLGASETTYLVTVEIAEPLVLRSEIGDELRMIVNDNLTGLSRFRITAIGREEARGPSQEIAA